MTQAISKEGKIAVARMVHYVLQVWVQSLERESDTEKRLMCDRSKLVTVKGQEAQFKLAWYIV